MADQARLLALSALDRVIKEGGYANLAAKECYDKLEGKDRAFFTRLFYGTLDKLVTMDWILSHYLKKRTPSTIRNILRLGMYQIYYMDSVPDFAACNASVELARKRGKGGASGFINAVLRRAARERDSLQWPDASDLAMYLSVTYSFPKWMVEMWLRELGRERCEALLSYQSSENTITIRPNSLRGIGTVELETMLNEAGYTYRRGSWVEDAFVIESGGDLITHNWFKDGKIAIQSEAAILVAELAMSQSPRKVWDCCAAPGGKTAAMAHYAKEPMEFSASDVHEHRVKLVKEQMRRLGVRADVFQWDATLPLDEKHFDLVLVDAPCSGLGTLWSQGDIKYSKKKEDIRNLSKIQRAILRSASQSVAAGGKLLYITCTISEMENEQVVKAFLDTHKEFKLIRFPEAMLKGKAQDTGLQLLPSEDQIEGFYMALMERC